MVHLMPQLFFPANSVEKSALIRFVCERIPRVADIPPHLAEPVGILDADGRLLAVAIWHHANAYGHVELTAAAVRGVHWCTKGIMRGLLHYAFQQQGARKMIVHIESGNQPAVKFARQSGMKREAVLRHHFERHAHAEVWTMMDTEYARSRWALVREVA